MDFPDEVDTPVDQAARKRYIKYRGVKSFRNCDWDPFENLPVEYSKIWRFQHYAQAQKLAIAKAQQEGLPISGTYVRITIMLDEESPFEAPNSPSRPMVFSTLFPHETKVSIMHFKIRRNDENSSIIPSSKVMEF